MLDSCDLIAFVPTVDLGRARSFYAGTLGLALTEQSEYACVFEVNATMLRVTLVGTAPAAGYTILGWNVPDIVATVRDLVSRGVTFERFDGMVQDDLGIWTTPDNSRVAWFKDPDRNTLSVTQFAG
jgi:predicted enzyme related to lactoylglutathione lyase